MTAVWSDILERQSVSGEFSILSYFILKTIKVVKNMPQLNLDNFQLQLGEVRTVSKDSGQTVESVELLLGDQTKAEMMVDENLNVMNLVVRDTVLADIPQLQCAVNKETLRNFISGLTKLYNTLQ